MRLAIRAVDRVNFIAISQEMKAIPISKVPT